MLEINIKLAAWNWLSLSAVREHCSESCVQVLLMLSDTWTELRTILMGFIISFFFRCGIARRVSTLSPPTSTISTTWSCGSTYPRTLQTGDNMVMLSFVHCHWLLSTEQFFFFNTERHRIGQWRMMCSFSSDIVCITSHEVLGSLCLSH